MTAALLIASAYAGGIAAGVLFIIAAVRSFARHSRAETTGLHGWKPPVTPGMDDRRHTG